MAEYASTGVWYIDIEQIILSRVRERLKKKYDGKDYYSGLNVTDDDKEIKDATFPAVYVQMLNPVEQGNTLEGNTVNAIICTVQVSVTDTDKSRARYVTAQIIQAMKLMLFESTSMPMQETETDTYTWTGRYRRMIGAGDAIPSAISDISE